MAISVITMTMVFIGVIIFVAETQSSAEYTPTTCESPSCDNDPQLCNGYQICEPVNYPIYDQIDMVVVSFFTIDYALRIFTSPFVPRRLALLISTTWDDDEEERAQRKARPPRLEPPPLAWYTQLLCYVCSLGNIVDAVVIVPFYISIANVSDVSLTFVRVLRLTRAVRIIKLGKNSKYLSIVLRTIIISGPTLACLMFLIGMSVIVFASIIYLLEQGTFTVNSVYPEGEYLRDGLVGDTEITPYRSIPVSIYWAIITCTTVGFGDIYPTSQGGRALAAICAIGGLFTLALPITVIGNTFARVYDEMLDSEKAKAEEIKRTRLIQLERKAAIDKLKDLPDDDEFPLKSIELSEFHPTTEPTDTSTHDSSSSSQREREGERALEEELAHTKKLLKLLMDDYQLVRGKVSKMSHHFDQIRQTTATLKLSASLTETEVSALTESLNPVALLHLDKSRVRSSTSKPSPHA